MRIRRADTSAFATSDFYMCVYPYMRLRSRIPVQNIHKMALSTLQARHLQMQDEELLVILGTYRVLLKRKSAKRRHRWWGNEILKRRNDQGAYHNLQIDVPHKVQNQPSHPRIYTVTSLSAWRSVWYLTTHRALTKTLTRLHEWAGWSEVCAGAHVIL